jgi:uncharacterized protein (DUF3820 family)
MAIFTDDTIMWFGEHRNKKLEDVPDSYLAWFWSENQQDYIDGKGLTTKQSKLMKYIEDNSDSIEI